MLMYKDQYVVQHPESEGGENKREMADGYSRNVMHHPGCLRSLSVSFSLCHIYIYYVYIRVIENHQEESEKPNRHLVVRSYIEPYYVSPSVHFYY
jgi:hypothetical protein